MAHVCVLGGANVDIEGRAESPLQRHDSNVGVVRRSPGGVGRNIAENLARLGTPTTLVTALGTDELGRWLESHATAVGVDMAHTVFCDDASTATYLSILDADGELDVALNDMRILDRLDAHALDDCHEVLASAQAIVTDCNLSAPALKHVFNAHPNATWFVDTVSATKAMRIAPYLSQVHTLKPNRIEAEVLSSTAINSHSDLPTAANALLDLGVQRVAISMGADGVFVADSTYSGLHPPTRTPRGTVTGAGDALLAGLVWAHLGGQDTEAAARVASAAAAVAGDSGQTVATEMSATILEQACRATTR